MTDFNYFCKRKPSSQNSVDIFKGSWKSAFPVGSNILAGEKNFFDNGIVETIDKSISGGLKGLNILEIGPFEAHYTYQLEKFFVNSIFAVEINAAHYLKCLIVKEVIGLKASFYLGDFMDMDFSDLHKFDFCFAAGVLYHQIDPLRMLKIMCNAFDRIYIWTHCYGDIIDAQKEKYPNFLSGKVELKEEDGFSCPHYYRTKRDPQGYSYWIRKEDIISFIKKKGFDKISVLIDTETHAAGPVFAFTAERYAKSHLS